MEENKPGKEVKALKVKDIREFINEKIITPEQELFLFLRSKALDMKKGLNTYLDSINFFERLDAIRKLAREHNNDVLEFKSIMLEAGVPLHKSFTMLDMHRIVNYRENKGEELTKKLMRRYILSVYEDEDMRTLLGVWQDTGWLKHRRGILNQVIDGHINGLYSLTIPALLAQMEGIIIECMLLLGKAERGKMVYQSEQREFLKMVFEINETEVPQGIYSISDLVADYYKKNIHAKSFPGDSINKELSRNFIHHGGDTDYGTKLNSIKAILLFDTLVDELNVIYSDIDQYKVKQES